MTINHISRDVVIFPSGSYSADRTDIPVKEPIQLIPTLQVMRLPMDVANAVMDACTPRGFNFKPYRQFGQLYSLVREHNDGGLNWDHDQMIQHCVALSRLVHPTSLSFEYSARIVYNYDGSIKQIIPGAINGSGAVAYSSDPDTDWLSDMQFNELRSLLQINAQRPLLGATSRAFWHNEYAARLFEIEMRWTMIVTALEAFLHIGLHKSTKQFTYRLPRLAQLVGSSITEDEAIEMYTSALYLLMAKECIQLRCPTQLSPKS